MDIVFETDDGRRLEEEIWYFSTVLEMKEKLQKKYGFPISRQSLYFNGNIMEDERDLEYYKVIQGSHILHRLKPEQELKLDPPKPNIGSKKGVKVTVLVPTTEVGMRKVEMEVNLADNVSELKMELLRMKEQIQGFDLPLEEFFFICKQNAMEENKTFRWHNIKSGDVIEIFGGSVTGES